jgi:hypothetical protein
MDKTHGQETRIERRRKDIEQIVHHDGLQRVFAAYYLWIYAKKENVNGQQQCNRESDRPGDHSQT